MKRLVLLLAVAVLLIATASVALADTTYTYTGNPFTDFSGIYPLSGTSNVSGSFTVAQALAPNLFDAQVTPTTWGFTDGHFFWGPGDYLDANGDGKPNGLVGTGAFVITTDSNGNITNWGISLHIEGPITLSSICNNSSGTIDYTLFTNNGEDFSIDSFNGTPPTSCLNGDDADNAGTPGTWTISTTGSGGAGGGGTVVPEPSGLQLLGAGMVGLLALAGAACRQERRRAI
jgi:hypothetical protein